MSITQRLIDRGVISEEQLAVAEESRKAPGDRLDLVLIRMGLAAETDVLSAMSEELHIPLVDLTACEIDVDVLRAMPGKLVHRQRLVPIRKLPGQLEAPANGSRTLTVATADPYDVYAFDELRMLTGRKVEPVLAPARDIDDVIKRYYGVGSETLSELVGDDVEIVTDKHVDEGDEEAQAQQASVVKLVNDIMKEAVASRASDVHIEPYERDLRIRYRIDGVLQLANIPPTIRQFQNAIISRIKILSKLNIAEKRLPQDGGFKMKYEGRDIDVRVSVIPMVHGEGVVLRILDKSRVNLRLDTVGMPPQIQQTFNTLINNPHGIVLVTGPTGSGKTTTLYAALNTIVNDELKILTVEDPVEYKLDGINQVETLGRIGLDFARALRSFLRHDPDVILVGEIRDKETATVAIEASLTGHLVFSTLHTNDACSATTRLLDMGIEPFLVTSTIEGVLAQRLIRTICPDCRTFYEPQRADTDLNGQPVYLDHLGKPLPPDLGFKPGDKLAYGAGCRSCRGIGFSGRKGIFELLVMTEALRELVMQRSGASKLIEQARKEGMRFLRDDGWDRVRAGQTTVEEVARVAAV